MSDPERAASAIRQSLPKVDEEAADPMNASLNPNALTDPSFVEWAKKKGRAVTAKNRRAYDAEQVKAAVPILRRVFPGLKVTYHDTVQDPNAWHAKHPNGVQRMSELDAEAYADKALSDIAGGKEYGILHNAKYGEIQYPLGKIGTINKKGKTQGGMGFLHIVEERMRKDGASLEEAIEIARNVGIAASIGTETKALMNTRWLDYKGVRAIIAITEDGTPIITGYEIRADGESAAFPPSESLPSHPVVREDEIVAALKNSTIVSQHDAESNSVPLQRLIIDQKSGKTLGWFAPDMKEVHLNPGATVETLAHEVLHAAQDWAKKNNPKLASALEKIAKECPRNLKQRIIRNYKTADADTLLKEWGAWHFMGEDGHLKGYVDLAPEVVKLAGESIGKNLLRDVMNLVSVVNMVVGDEEKDVRNMPVVRDFVRTTGGNDTRFYEASNEYRDNVNAYRNGNLTEAERKAYLKRFPHVGDAWFKNVDATIKRYRKLEDGYAFRNGGKAVPHEWPKEKVEEFREKRLKLQADFIRRMGMK